jgi:hypothetical protein
MPNEFSNSYKNNFRNIDGTPGKNYFTNYSDYTINVKFNPKTGFLDGKETIIYHNNSPQNLKKIVIRLYKNLFKKGSPRDFSINPYDINNGINITKISVNNKNINIHKLKIYATNLYLNLENPLKSHEKIEIKIEWNLTMPQKTTIRNGKYGKNIYFVGYWYPQIAVYDDIFGWDKNTYTGAEEFYNDHSNFDVKISVPYPNIVWATGELKNFYDVFNKKYANLIKKAQYSTQVINIITPQDYEEEKILKNKKQNTWHFIAQKVPDFAFATSDKHNWDAISINIPDKTKPVIINAVYTDSSKIYHTLAQTARQIISYYSFKRPGIFFPYPTMTIFEGGGGMEYPMMVNEGNIEKECLFHYVTAHEIGHSYFPFFTGTNETSYAWMDEGLMSFFPRLAVDNIWKKCNTRNDITKNYAKIAGTKYDLPIMIPSDIFKKFFAYRNIAYNRPAYAFSVLHQYLGDSLFFAALRTFTNRWHYKHPYPYDFFFTFNNISKQNLNWFWKAYFFDFAKPDLAIKNVKFDGANLNFTIQNIGGLPQPIIIKILLKNNKNISYKKNISVWKNSKTYKISIPLRQKPKKIILGNKNIPDTNNKNNKFQF